MTTNFVVMTNELFDGIDSALETKLLGQLKDIPVTYNYNLPVGKVVGVHDGYVEVTVNLAAVLDSEFLIAPTFGSDGKLTELSIIPAD